MEWPGPSNLDLLLLQDEDDTNRIYSLDNPLFDRVQIYMVLGAFWAAMDYARHHPEADVTWKIDYEVTGPDHDPTPNPPWLEVFTDHQGKTVDLTPAGYDAELLARGLRVLGFSTFCPTLNQGIRINPDAPDQTIRACLGEAYALWWRHRCLSQRLDNESKTPAFPKRPRM